MTKEYDIDKNYKKILIFSGTTEGRTLAIRLSKSKIYCDVCVATEYGQEVMPTSKYIKVIKGRMTSKDMSQLIINGNYDACIDATHSYATIVSDNINESVEKVGIPLLCLKRQVLEYKEDCLIEGCKDVCECIEKLKEIDGNILLTTGSKNLLEFCENESIRKRIIARVLPGIESIELCKESGLLGKQIIAMQGPFSVTLNEALIKEYNIKVMVTKASGTVGGMDSKLEAAKRCKIPCLIIEPPMKDVENGLTMAQVIDKLESILSVHIPKSEAFVKLVGIGMGSINTLTIDAKLAIENADYIFGAKRLLENVSEIKKFDDNKKFQYYLADDIIPEIENILEKSYDDKNIVVLFSGDTGFYSGCSKLYERLGQLPYTHTLILPGISSVSMMSAITGISWQDAGIISTHGIQKNEWLPKLIESVNNTNKSFIITSGRSDVIDICDELYENLGVHLTIYVGYQLSFSTQKLYEFKLPLENDIKDSLEKDGLYTCLVINEMPTNNENRIITPHITDDEFIRDKVPMTKEQIRHLCVCELKLLPDSVVYDIGAGTGSISVEIAKLNNNIQVFAIEENELAYKLINDNIDKFGVKNVCAIKGVAPDVLENLKTPTHAFIGGSRGHIKDIIEVLRLKNPNIRIVVNAVSLELIIQMQQIMKNEAIVDEKITCINVSNAKKLGDYNMMIANNPVYIFSFSFAGNN